MQTLCSGISPVLSALIDVQYKHQEFQELERKNIYLIYTISPDKPFGFSSFSYRKCLFFSFFFQNTMAKPALQKPVSHAVVKEPVVSPAREEDRKGSPYGQWVPVKKEEKKTFLNFSPKSSLFRAR